MRKILLTILFWVMLVSSAYAGPSHFKPVDCKFDDATTALTVNSTVLCSATIGTIAVDTDWFPADIGANDAQFWIPVRHTFQFSCPAATVINLQVAGEAVTGDKEFIFNSGIAIGVDNAHQFSVILYQGMTYNIQHKTGTQNCSVFITETFSDDL